MGSTLKIEPKEEKVTQRSQELKLLAAVFWVGIADYLNGNGNNFKSAKRWIECEKVEYVSDFVSCCTILGLNCDVIRRIVYSKKRAKIRAKKLNEVGLTYRR
jgi:hypothetical protein